MRAIIAAALCACLLGCSIERSQTANQARSQMVGMSREQVLACMGPPGQRLAEGATEVWSYASGDGKTITTGSGVAQTRASAYGGPGYASGSATTLSSGSAVSRSRHCTVHVIMSEGSVSKINFSGPTGGLLTKGEQCSYAVANCVQ